MEKDETSVPQQGESDTTHLLSSTPPKFTNDTLKPESPSVSGDHYKTRNRLLDNTSVQSFEETLYLAASQPIDSLSDSSTNNKIADAANEAVEHNDEAVEHNDQQTVESEVTKIAEEW